MNDEFSVRINLPFLVGVQLAVNAIADAALLIDASDCVLSISEILKNHDMASTLLDVRGYHRVFHTDAGISSMSMDRTEYIIENLRTLESSGRMKVLFITSTPMTVVTGFQYDKMIRSLSPSPAIPVIDIPRPGLLGDWLNGYADTLKTLAGNMRVQRGSTDPSKAAIVGYFMDRSEEDHVSNIAELKRILRDGLSLDLISTWLSNSPLSGLEAVRNAGVIISLPYAREAARILADKTGAILIETNPPIGLDGTVKWIYQIAEATGGKENAREFIDRELSLHIPKIEWAIPRWFMNKRIDYCGDPYLLPEIKSLVEELGCSFTCSAVFCEKDKIENAGALKTSLPCEPGDAALRASILEKEKLQKTGLFIANSIAAAQIISALGREARIMEFGFPSYFHHAVHDSPFMGFRGALCFINRMANILAAPQVPC